MSIKTIMIEDEQPARDIVKRYLQEHTEIELIGEYADGFTGIKAINEKKPDLLILDIQLPKLTGFEILELIDYKPVIIFATAFDQFAIKAFELNAVDYLLKPFTAERFASALQKAKSKLVVNNGTKEISNLIQSVENQEEVIERIVVKSGSKIKVIPTQTIHYIEAQDDYVMIYTSEGKFLKEKTMKYFENHLDIKDFVRVHRSFIVNLNEIVKLEPFEKDGYIVILKNQAKIKVSASGYKKLKEILKF